MFTQSFAISLVEKAAPSGISLEKIYLETNVLSALGFFVNVLFLLTHTHTHIYIYIYIYIYIVIHKLFAFNLFNTIF